MIYRTKTMDTYEVVEGMTELVVKYTRNGVVDYVHIKTDNRETAEVVASYMAIAHNEGYLIGKGDK